MEKKFRKSKRISAKTGGRSWKLSTFFHSEVDQYLLVNQSRINDKPNTESINE